MEVHFVNFSTRFGSKLFSWLIAFEIGFLLIFLIGAAFGPIGGMQGLFNLDREANLPTWFSSTQLFVIGAIFLLMSYQGRGSYHLSPKFLLLAGMGFVLLSADEAASFHEEITAQLKNIAWVPRFKGNHGIWILFYSGIGLMVGLAIYQELWAMWQHYRHEAALLGLGFVTLLVGAVGLEIVSYLFLRDGAAPLLYKLEVALEEFLEMAGASVILYGAILLAGHDDRSALQSPPETGQEQVMGEVSTVIPG
jgi:hypothetical protein